MANENGKMTHEDFTLPLALFDGVPVALFFANGMLLCKRIRTGPAMISWIFLGGALSAFAGGAAKVAWKTAAVTEGKDIRELTAAFRTLLPAGLTAMTLSGLAGTAAAAKRSGAGALAGSLTLPAAGFYALGACGAGLMGYLGRHMDDSARSNWIEEITNTAAQAAFLAGTLSLGKQR